MVEQPNGEYLTHLILERGSAASVSNPILEFTGNHEINDTLKVIGCDLTNVNIGSNGGVIHLIEEKLDHKRMWLICSLHTNELPLGHLFTKLDGKRIVFQVRNCCILPLLSLLNKMILYTSFF